VCTSHPPEHDAMKLQTALLVVFACTYASLSMGSGVCGELGFDRDTLLCSTCSKLESFVADETLVAECRSCCTDVQDESGSESTTRKYKTGELRVCSRKLGAYPQVQDFIEEDLVS